LRAKRPRAGQLDSLTSNGRRSRKRSAIAPGTWATP
jgi:hypothetical protein